jgi:hypothetical protein
MRFMTGLLALVLVANSSWPSVRADEVLDVLGVKLFEAPEGGIQPQAAIDDRGAIHLVFFKGEPAGGDLYYSRLEPGTAMFSTPIRVNSQPGSAIAIGTIRGGQIAVGRDGRIHVAWNGSNGSQPRNPSGGSPMLYARSRSGPDGAVTAFEPQRNLMRRTSALDGGGTIAADRAGNVYVAWHARTEDADPGEAGRRMWVVRSKDDGATFSAEAPAIDRQIGACACCGTRALADRNGTLYLLYRAATGGIDRDMYLLSSDDHAGHFRGDRLHPWRAQVCPMSTTALADTGTGVLAAWETQGQVYFSRIDPRTHQTSPPIAPPDGHGDRKHPAVAGNARGETILVWTEGTGWQKGGSLAWRVFDRNGQPNGPAGRTKSGVPVWGLATVVARPDNGFTIISSHSSLVRVERRPRRDQMLGLASAVIHPRVAQAAQKLNEATDIDEEVDAAHDLVRIDNEAARVVLADYTARSPLRGFDRQHRILLILDGSTGSIHEVPGAKRLPIRNANEPPEVPSAMARVMDAAMDRALSQMKTKVSMKIGDPPVLWSAIRRLPDGAVAADEGGGANSVCFILCPKDEKSYHYITYKFQGADIEDSAIHDAKGAQLRRWKASDWWPKEWR